MNKKEIANLEKYYLINTYALNFACLALSDEGICPPSRNCNKECREDDYSGEECWMDYLKEEAKKEYEFRQGVSK